MDRDLPLMAKVVVAASAAATVVLSTWTTIIAFVGGTMPILGWQTDGGPDTGLLWLFFVDPLVVTVCWWLTVVVLLPIVAMGGDDR